MTIENLTPQPETQAYAADIASIPDQTVINMTPNAEQVSEHESWLRRNRVSLGLAGFAVAGAASVVFSHQLGKTVHDLEAHAKIGLAIPVTEAAAWAGAGMMVASAGKKVGNPFTIKPRLKELRSELSDNRLYRAGWSLGAVGAIGTAAVVAGASVTELPPSSWPLAAAVSATSIAFSTIPFRPSKKPEQKENK